MAMFQMGQTPATAYLCAALGLCACLHGIYLDRYQLTRQGLVTLVGETIVIPALILVALRWGDIPNAGFWPQALMTVAIVSAIGSYTYRIRSEEHTSELQSLMRISYAVFCLKKKKHTKN